MNSTLQEYLDEHLAVALDFKALLPEVEKVAVAICQALDAGRCLFICGNGGSAADAQHFAAELVGRYRVERRALPAIALTTDSSALTCIGNDYDFADIFKRQIEGLVRPGDVVVGITTSGDSENVLRGLKAARAAGAVTVSLTGGTGGKAGALSDYLVAIPTTKTARIQEMHVLVIHMICDCIDDWASSKM